LLFSKYLVIRQNSNFYLAVFENVPRLIEGTLLITPYEKTVNK